MLTPRKVACLIAFVLATAVPGMTWAAGDCAAIIPVMKLHTSENTTGSSLLRIASFLESDKSSSYEQLQSSSHSAGFNYDVIGATYGDQDAHKNFAAWKEAVIQGLRMEASSNSSHNLVYETIASDAVKAWDDCVNSTGLHIWAEPDDTNPNAFTVLVKYRSTNPRDPFITFIPDLKTSTNATCDKLQGVLDAPGPPAATRLRLRLFSRTPAFILGGDEPFSTSCTRTNTESASATVTTQLASEVVRVPRVLLCNPSSQIIRGSCPYPQTDGEIIQLSQSCMSGDPLSKPVITPYKNTCRDVGCRSSTDIVKTLAQSLYGGPIPDAEVQSYVNQLESRRILDIPRLVAAMAKDKRFFDRQLPPAMFQNPSPYFSSTGLSCDFPTQARLVNQLMVAAGATPGDAAVADIVKNPNVIRGTEAWPRLCSHFDQAGVNSLMDVVVPYLQRQGGADAATVVPAALTNGVPNMHMCLGVNGTVAAALGVESGSGTFRPLQQTSAGLRAVLHGTGISGGTK